MPFYDKNRKIQRVAIYDDQTSLLRQKQIIINFKEDYIFAQAIGSLIKKSMNYQGIFYNFECPTDKNLSAG